MNDILISDENYSRLPGFIREVCDTATTPNERDLQLISTLAVLSGCVNVTGNYNKERQYANLFVLVIAPPASGKGRMKCARILLEEYEEFLSTPAANQEGTKPKNLFIPANVSSAALYDALNQSDGVGIIFETEADTISNALKQDWGGFSDVLRKSFHQEPISLIRKGGPYLKIKKPRFAIALSGTTNQLRPFIDSVENGLFSRFIFHVLPNHNAWVNVSPSANAVSLDASFEPLKAKCCMLLRYSQANPFEMTLSTSQWETLDARFSRMQQTKGMEVTDLVPSIRRLGLIVFKLCMVLTSIRRAESEQRGATVECAEDDFQIALGFADRFLASAEAMMLALPRRSTYHNPTPKHRLLDKLPAEFRRKDIVEMRDELGLSTRTIDEDLKNLLAQHLTKAKAGYYKKV